MAASKVDDEAKKKETVNKQEVESLTNMLFLRKNTEKVSPYQKFNKKAAKGVREFCEAHLVGTIDEGPPSATKLCDFVRVQPNLVAASSGERWNHCFHRDKPASES
ncbi:hypothetical protein Y032_0008g38 [Ancylostoma ceylanicum]|uniref:Uncharacterized protein n=1 Tax=Ancylostoma ceylanicum TaxID=53326 RepID=A0A016VL85_9BILA|nr:hypothetical protein Y032_0008g38 [Ancylostoma ceylanicum]